MYVLSEFRQNSYFTVDYNFDFHVCSDYNFDFYVCYGRSCQLGDVGDSMIYGFGQGRRERDRAPGPNSALSANRPTSNNEREPFFSSYTRWCFFGRFLAPDL